MVMAANNCPTGGSHHSVTSRTRHTASFRGLADLESIRSLNWSDAIDSDHSLDVEELLRL
jgi:DNA topoisomerase IB